MNDNARTNSASDEHVIDLIEAYLAGGLDPAERVRVELHVAACETCAHLLEEARRADATLRELFIAERPADDFEDRLVRVFREAPQARSLVPRPLLHPMAKLA